MYTRMWSRGMWSRTVATKGQRFFHSTTSCRPASGLSVNVSHCALCGDKTGQALKSFARIGSCVPQLSIHTQCVLQISFCHRRVPVIQLLESFQCLDPAALDRPA